MAEHAEENEEQGSETTIVSFGETLWDLLPTGKVLGGAPFNFAYRVKTLGYESAMVTQLGADELGREARQRIEELGMNADYVYESAEYPTGTVEVTLDQDKNPDYYITPEVAYDYVPLEEELIELAEEAECICYGTLAQRGATSRETVSRMLEAFGGRYRLLDINLRKGCWTRESIKHSIARCDILKLNTEETPELARTYGYDVRDVRSCAERIVKDHDVSYVVVTLGAKGACAVGPDGAVVLDGAYRVELVDPLGSGDAFAAGMVTSLLQGHSLEEACRRGNAMGAYVATQRGATEPFTLDELESFMASHEQARIEDTDLAMEP
jgi:fructokinase